MNFHQWLDKYRIIIGIILITIIGIGLIFLFWDDKILGKNNNGQDQYVVSLESRISELENKISQTEQNGQIAGQSNENNQNPKEKQTEKININIASVEELDQLPGVGSTRAQYIIEYREKHNGFKTISEIKNIKGIGPATYEKMKDLITIE